MRWNPFRGLVLSRLGRIQDDITIIRRRLDKIMADITPTLDKLADDLAAFGAGPFAELVGRNTYLENRNAELEAAAAGQQAEEVRESGAAVRAVDAFNALARPVTQDPAAPDVPEVPSVAEIPPVTEDAPAPSNPEAVDGSNA